MNRVMGVVIALALPIAVRGQTPRPEILIVGTFHMANPGHDLANISADDVLAPKRQQEMARLLDALRQFHPTKIAIESDITSNRATQQYADYLAGRYVLTRNEIDQIGFRLAKELGLKTIYSVDVDGDFPYMRVRNYAKANGRADEFAAIDARIAAAAKEQGAFLASHTLLAMLQLVNSDSVAARGVAVYYDWVRFGEPWEYAGSDLLAAWFQRNIRIYRNIVALADSANERILVLYGYGHLAWLRQDAANDPRVRLRRLDEFVKGCDGC